MIPDRAPAGAPAPSRILVVDDNPDVAGIVRLAVRKMPRKVEVASEVNADRALDRLRHESFDLVLGDLRLREMDGLDFLKRAKDMSPSGKRVLFTAYAGHMDKEALARAGVDGVLEKPMLTSALAEVLDAVLAGDTHTLDALKRGVDVRSSPSRP